MGKSCHISWSLTVASLSTLTAHQFQCVVPAGLVSQNNWLLCQRFTFLSTYLKVPLLRNHGVWCNLNMSVTKTQLSAKQWQKCPKHMHECKADPHLMDFDISFKASFPLYVKLRTRHHPFPHKMNQSIKPASLPRTSTGHQGWCIGRAFYCKSAVWEGHVTPWRNEAEIK